MTTEYGQFTDPLGTLNDILGTPETQIATMESYAPSNRPQDIRYSIPERGVVNHGVREDTPLEGYAPDQVSGDPEIPTFDGPVYAEVVPPIPVPVYDVPNPLSSIRRWSQFNTVYDGSESYAGAIGVPDVTMAVSIAAVEDRVRLTVRASRTVLATVGAQFAFAISGSNDFTSYIVIGYPSATMEPDTLILENVKDAVYLTIVPLAAFSGATQNAASLSVIQEYAKPVDHNPYAVS